MLIGENRGKTGGNPGGNRGKTGGNSRETGGKMECIAGGKDSISESLCTELKLM